MLLSRFSNREIILQFAANAMALATQGGSCATAARGHESIEARPGNHGEARRLSPPSPKIAKESAGRYLSIKQPDAGRL
jgi:hypothetical protein